MLWFRRELEELTCYLQSLLERSLPKQAVNAKRVEAILEDSVTRVERALKHYEVRLSSSVTMISDQLTRDCKC